MPNDATTNNGVDETSDYARVGGGRAVSQVVDRFYERLQADQRLAPFFVGVDMNRLKRHQVLLVSQVMGGPADYDGRDLRSAHQGLGITSSDFGLVVSYLIATLEEAGVSPDIIKRVGDALSGTEQDIVSAGVR